MMSRSRGRRPILGSSGSLGHRPERLGPSDIPEERAPVAGSGGRGGGGVTGWAPLSPPGRARRAFALPFLRKSGSRLALARPEPASPPPPSPWSAQPLASAPRPLSAASLPSPLSLSPPLQSLLCAAPLGSLPASLSSPLPWACSERPSRADPLSLRPGLQQSAGLTVSGGGRRSLGRSQGLGRGWGVRRGGVREWTGKEAASHLPPDFQ